MAHSEFDKQMKGLEWFAAGRVPDGVYPILRIDGRAFSKVTQRLSFEKPYDHRFHDIMTETARAVMENLGGIYAYHQSDEISVLLPHTDDLFDRRAEKLVSVAAGLASAAFNRELVKYTEYEQNDELPHFDARLVCAISQEAVLDYFRWRLQDASRNCLNSWAHWTAVLADGKTTTQAAALFHGQTVGFKNEYLHKHGTNFNELPLWQRRGSGLYWEAYMKAGTNPKLGIEVLTMRRRIQAEHKLPMGEDYYSFLTDIMARGWK